MMKSNRDVIILCRDRRPTMGVDKRTMEGLLVWGSHLKNRWLVKNPTAAATACTIKSKIENNITLPEWMGGNRFGLFDLLNYVLNGRRYVHHPGSDPRFFDPLGIPTGTSIHLYDHLRKSGFNPVNIENLTPRRQEAADRLRQDPLAVVISTTFFIDAAPISRIIREIRAVNREVAVIIGGSTLLTRLTPEGRLPTDYEALIDNNGFAILEDPGLDRLGPLLSAIAEGSDPGAVPNIARRDNGRVVYSRGECQTADFENIFPDWGAVADITGGVAFVRASQGCAFKCKFCTFPKANVKLRHRSTESIRRELRLVHDAGIRHFSFTDDHFSVSPQRVEEICRMIIAEKFSFTWYAGIRASSITAENAELLEEAGCKVLSVGLESGDDRVLKLMHKGTTTSGNMRCLEILDKRNILAHGSFMIGFPGETRETVETTIRWINRSPLKLYKVWLFYLLPGSIVHDEQQAHQISFFGGEYSHCLWKTPTFDALSGSELLKSFILRVERAALLYNYSPMYGFFPFFLRGCTTEQVVDFCRMRTRLVKNELGTRSLLARRRRRMTLLRQLEQMLEGVAPAPEGRR
jgi:p-methyltransferase